MSREQPQVRTEWRNCWMIVAAAGLLALLGSASFLSAQEREDNHVAMVNDGVEEDHANAIESLVETAWRIYVEDLGLKLPPLITAHLTLDPKEELRLYTDGQSHVFLLLRSMDQLRPSPKSGVFNVYGFCHELGHIAMYHRMKTVSGIHPDVAEAWAHLCGSIVCDEVYAKKGRKLWPEPFDYRKAEGTARIRNMIRKRRKARSGSSDFEVAVKAFWDLYLLAKKKAFFAAAEACLESKPTGEEFLPRFLKEVRKASRKKRLPDFFPERMLRRQVSWEPGPPDLSAKATFQDLKVSEKKNKACVLHYNAEPPDPEVRRSIGGTGYFQLFRTPAEKQARLTGIELFGCRYGREADDDQDVVVWVCDAEMKVLHEHRFKYRQLNRGKSAWLPIPSWKPAEVPRHFLVGVFFNAHATKGYFIGYQTRVHGHSYTGTPTTGLSLLKGQDWMMRVTIELTEK